MSTTSVPRTAKLALLGGALWVLLPVAWAVATPQETEFGSLGFVAVAGSMWIFLVAAPALLVAGVSALRSALGGTAGRVGGTGLVIAGLGYAAMALGNGIEVASMTVGGGEIALGHAIFLIGFLVSVVGGILLGIVVFRRFRDPLCRTAAGLLALALPIGIGIGILGSAIAPENDASFWAAISLPTGVAWVLLGLAMRGIRQTTPASEYVAVS